MSAKKTWRNLTQKLILLIHEQNWQTLTICMGWGKRRLKLLKSEEKVVLDTHLADI